MATWARSLTQPCAWQVMTSGGRPMHDGTVDQPSQHSTTVVHVSFPDMSTDRQCSVYRPYCHHSLSQPVNQAPMLAHALHNCFMYCYHVPYPIPRWRLRAGSGCQGCLSACLAHSYKCELRMRATPSQCYQLFKFTPAVLE